MKDKTPEKFLDEMNVLDEYLLRKKDGKYSEYRLSELLPQYLKYKMPGDEERKENTGISDIAQWVINNRYPKSENRKISDVEMYDILCEKIEQLESEKQNKAVGFVEWLNDNPSSEFVIVRGIGYDSFEQLYKQFEKQKLNH